MRDDSAGTRPARRWRRTARPGTPHRTYLWIALAALVAAGGLAGSTLAAQSLAHSDANHSRTSFARSSADVASTLQLSIRLGDGLVVSTAAFYAANPTASRADLHSWIRSVQAFQRFPELSAVHLVAMVRAQDLPAFTRRVTADPQLAPGGQFNVNPPGERPFYCLIGAGETRDAWNVPPGLDLCDYDAVGPVGEAIVTARDSGEPIYVPVNLGSITVLGVQAPAYRGGVVPSTLETRREAFLGTVGITTNPYTVMAQALRGHQDMAVSMRYRAGVSDVTFTIGNKPAHPQTITTDLYNGWTIQTFAPTAPSAVFSDPDAALLLLAGGLASLTVGLLVVVLVTSRARALGLVRKRTEQLHHQALHDSLTGLPNRALIMDRADQLLRRARRQGSEVAALIVDLDDFKGFNDTLGHALGDRLLASIAERLQTALRDADTVGRLGGDEFVVLMDNSTLEAAPELVAHRLLDVMHRPFELEGSDLPFLVNVSIGIARGDRVDADQLLRDADLALHQAKSAGENQVEVFHPGMQTAITERVSLELDLRGALDDNQFQVYYQPIFDLTDLSPVGVEALLRWRHPARGLVLPDQFIPLLERTGQIIEVGRWVLHEACRQTAEWHSRGANLTVAVNVSARQLDDERIVTDVADALTASGLPAKYLVIEVTETVLMRNIEATARLLHSIKKLGVSISIDDFGTGYSSLAYLHKFPVDDLKIDRMFISAISTTPESAALISTFVQLGHDLGLKTLAEGVETLHQMEVLQAAHVDLAQGFLLGRPTDAPSLEKKLFALTRLGRPTVADGHRGHRDTREAGPATVGR